MIDSSDGQGMLGGALTQKTIRTNFQMSQMISGYRSISPGQNIEVGHGGTGQLQLLFLIRQNVSKEILRSGL